MVMAVTQETPCNMLRNRKAIAQICDGVAQGYQESWNIVSERSKADDTAFVESIVLKLADCANIKKDDFSVFGASNGAALVNQLMIESRLPHFRNFISGVSPLNAWQHDGTHFKARGDGNDYRQPAKPATGRRLMKISGTNDRLVLTTVVFPHIFLPKVANWLFCQRKNQPIYGQNRWVKPLNS